MQYTYTLFVGNAYLGKGTGTQRGRDGRTFPPDHHAVCCVFCGEIWARFLCDNPKAKWFFLHQPCERCGTGRLNVDYWIGPESGAPDGWLAREFLLALQYGEHYWTFHHCSHEQFAALSRVPAEDLSITTSDLAVALPEF